MKAICEGTEVGSIQSKDTENNFVNISQLTPEAIKRLGKYLLT